MQIMTGRLETVSMIWPLCLSAPRYRHITMTNASSAFEANISEMLSLLLIQMFPEFQLGPLPLDPVYLYKFLVSHSLRPQASPTTKFDPSPSHSSHLIRSETSKDHTITSIKIRHRMRALKKLDPEINDVFFFNLK